MRKRLTVAVLALLLVSPLILFVAGPPWAEWRARAAWRAAGWPLEGFAARHPQSGMNATAEALVLRCRPLGLHFGSDLPAPPPAAQQAFGAIMKDLRRHVEALAVGRPSRASAGLSAFRNQHADELAALLSLLAESPPPAWELDVARGLTAPLAPVGAHRDIAALLTLFALDPRPGDPPPEVALRALVRLGGGLRGRPELASLLLSTVVDGRALAVARRVEAPPAALLEVLGRDRKPALFPALQGEALQLQSFATGYRGAGSPSLWPRPSLPDPFVRAYFRLSAADYTRVLAGVADRFARAPVCSPPAVRPEQDLADLGRWNTVGRAALFDYRVLGRVLLLHALNVELTEKVLALRAGRSEGRWPDGLADPASRVCEQSAWTYERRPDGSVIVAWGGPLEPGEADSLRFEAR